MHERGVSTAEVKSRQPEVTWAQFCDFVWGGEIPRTAQELDDLHIYAHSDIFERCGEEGTPSGAWFAHPGGGYIREADLKGARQQTAREAWTLKPDELAHHQAIARAKGHKDLPSELRIGIRPSADLDQMFAAIKGLSQAKVRIHNSILVDQMWQARQKYTLPRDAMKTSAPRPDMPLVPPRQYAHLTKRTDPNQLPTPKGAIYISSSWKGSVPEGQPSNLRQNIARKIAGIFSRLRHKAV